MINACLEDEDKKKKKKKKKKLLCKRMIKFNIQPLGFVTAIDRALTAHNWQNEKEYSWRVPAMKFIGMK